MSTQEERIRERLHMVRQHLDSWEVEGLLIGSATNRRWLSGFTGSAGWLLVTAEEAYLATDFRYWAQAQAQAPAFDLFRLTNETKITALVNEVEADPIGVEAQHLTLDEYDTLQQAENVSWKPLKNTLEPWRAVKTPDEVTRIQAAAAITDEVMERVNLLARPGQSEAELAWQLEKALREAGADGIAFPIIVASGPNAALPHHHPGERTLQKGDTLIVDMGASLDGYNSDLTRSFYLGDEPEERFQQVYENVLQAQLSALNGIRPQMTGRAVDALARDVINAAGHEEHFGHGLGHGLGMEVHEAPRLSSRGIEDLLEPGMVVTVEPGIYITGWGGVRIEDLILVGEKGAILLSHCPKTPLIPV